MEHSFLACPICQEYFIFPMAAQCTHTVCHKCSYKINRCPMCNLENPQWIFNVSIANALESLMVEYLSKHRQKIDELHTAHRLLKKYQVEYKPATVPKTEDTVIFIGKILDILDTNTTLAPNNLCKKLLDVPHVIVPICSADVPGSRIGLDIINVKVRGTHFTIFCCKCALGGKACCCPREVD